VVWERKIADPAIGQTLTIAPLIVRDLAVVGAAGGDSASAAIPRRPT
jgi:alcohol dehydrogenase (cytochrome c)